MAVQISVQASQTALAQSIAQGVAAFNARYASQNQLNLQVNASGFTQPLGRITGNLKEFESALAASNARVLAFGASTAVIGGVGKAFREIADVTIEVEKNITDINRVLGLSTDKLQKFSSDLFGVAKQTASSFQDAAKASLEFSRQGLNAEDTLKKTADALTLVRLTGVSAAQAVEDLTAATNAFKETGLTTNDILNKIVAVEQQFAVSADDLTSAVSRTGQAAKEAGVNFDQLNALVASAQEKTARGGAVIGNALKTIFTRLQRTETLDQLENFNIAVRDIEGNVLPAIQILQNFAGAYKDLSTAQKASLSEQVAGVYQVNILKSIITDLNEKQGVYNRALDYGTQATNEAEQANAKLNLTLAALISQTGTNLQQLSNNIGKVTFEPVFKSLVSPFNDAVTYINDLLEGEGIGSQFANGLLLGIKNILSGPGLVGAVAVIGKVITNTFSYASSALPALFGITTETQKRKNIEEAVLKIIQSQSQVSLALRGQQGNLVAQSQILFNLAQAQTAEYQQQLATAKQLAAALTPRNITVGQAGLQVGKIKAGGYIPRDVQNAEVMGAAIGGYKAGKVVKAPVGGVMNTAETVKYIPGFAQPFINPPAGSKAGRMHRIKSINQTGIDPYAANGFLPNFAIPPAYVEERYDNVVRGKTPNKSRNSYSLNIDGLPSDRLNADLNLDFKGTKIDAGYSNADEIPTRNKYFDQIYGQIKIVKFLEKEMITNAVDSIWEKVVSGKNDYSPDDPISKLLLSPDLTKQAFNRALLKNNISLLDLRDKYNRSNGGMPLQDKTFKTIRTKRELKTPKDFQESLFGDKNNFIGSFYEGILLNNLKGYVLADNEYSAVDLVGDKYNLSLPPLEAKGGQAELDQLIRKGIRSSSLKADDKTGPENFGRLVVVQPYGSGLAYNSGFIPNFSPIIDDNYFDKHAFPGGTAIGPIPDKAIQNILDRQRKRQMTYLDFDRTLVRTMGDIAYAKVAPDQKKGVLQKMFLDKEARLKDVKGSKLTQFGELLRQKIQQKIIDPSLLGLMTASDETPGMPEYISSIWGIQKRNQVYSAKPGTKEARLASLGVSANGFIPNFATGLSPKVTRLPWLKSFANKEWFNKFPWFNDIDLKNTSQNMDYNPYTGERKLIAGSEMFRELNFLTHGNNKNLTTGNSPLFSYLYEEYVRDILNEVTKNKSIKDAEEAGFPMRDKYGNPTKFDPFKAANTAPMDALIRNRAGRIGGIEIKGGTEENWKTKDILKKEQDFETQNPGSTLGRRTRVYSNMYKGTDFLTKGLLKRLGVDKAKIITNKLISFYADKIAGHESEIESNWKANKGLSGGFVPNFASDVEANASLMRQVLGIMPFLVDLKRGTYAEGDMFHFEIANKKFVDPKTKKSIYGSLSDKDIHGNVYQDTFLRGFYNPSSGVVDFELTEAQKKDESFMTRHSVLLNAVKAKYKKRFEEAIQSKPRYVSPLAAFRNEGFVPNFGLIGDRLREAYTGSSEKTTNEVVPFVLDSNGKIYSDGKDVHHEQIVFKNNIKKWIRGYYGVSNSKTQAPSLNFSTGSNDPSDKIFSKYTSAANKLSLLDKLKSIFTKAKTVTASQKFRDSLITFNSPDASNLFSKGFIPNFAYQQAVMSLEESMSGNKAILDTSTGPFPFIRNSSQPNFASAVADHGGVQNALKDSMAGQKAAGLMADGNIPNFAAPNPITLTGKGYAGNAKVEQAINNYLKSIDILTISNSDIRKALDGLYKTLGLTGQEFEKLKKEVVAHAKAEKKAAQAFIGPMPQQNTATTAAAAVPLGPPNPTALQSARLRASSFGRKANTFAQGIGNNLAFTLGAPLIAGQLESAITRGRDRSELSVGERFAGSAISSGLTNISTGASLGTALAPILGPLAPFGPAIGAATGAIVGLGTAAFGASDNLEDLQKKAENYRNQTQEAIQSGKGIIDTVKSLGNLDPNSLEAFDANQKLEEYFIKISETGLDEKFREAGSDVEKMTEAIKAYEMERMAGAKRVAESANRMSKKDLSIEELGKKGILRTEKAAVTKYAQNQGLGGATSSYVVMEDVIASTGEAGEANFKKIVTQNSQLFADLENVQNQLKNNFVQFATEFKSQFSDLVFNQGELSDILKKYNVTGIDANALAVQLQEVAKDNGDYGKFIVNNFDKIIEGLVSGKYKTAAEAAKAQKEIAQRQEGVRQKLFQYSQAIEQAIASTAMQIENYDFEKSFGKLNLEKSSQLINDGLAAISKNIDNAFKNQFDLLVGETANIQQKRMLDFDAANFEKGFALQKESRTLGRSKELVTVLQGALEETAAGNIDQVVEAFQKTGKVDISTISGLKKGEESKRAIQAFNLTTSLEEKAAKNKDDNARKIFMAEQAYANKSLELKSAVGKLDYDLSERRYKNTLREKELVDSITNQNKQIQIKGQAQIERSRIETESPYFMLGRGEYAISDEKRKREAQNTQKGFELEARQAIADAEIARIQREVFADNTDATLKNTTAIEDLIMAMTQEGAKNFETQTNKIAELDKQIQNVGSTISDEAMQRDPLIVQKERKKLEEEKQKILSSSEYASGKAASDLRNRQIEMQAARQEIQKRKVQGGAFNATDLSNIKDPVQYLKDRASEERKILESLQAQKDSLTVQSEKRVLTNEESQKLKTLDEQIAKQRTVVNDVDNANLSIQEKITTEKTRQNQLDKDREKRGKFGTGVSKALGDIRTEIDTFEERLGGTTVTAFRDGLVGAMDAAINRTDDLGSALLEVAGGFLKSIQNAMFQQIANQIVSGAGFAIGKQKGGVIHAQAGMYISDAGRTGDVNPAMLEDGEYVLNRKTVKALGGPKEIDKLNFGMFPRFGVGARRFADGGNTGSVQAAASMNEPFAQLSEFGKENNPEYQKYLERIREEQAKKDAKKAQRSALVRSLIGTALTTGIMMGVGSLAKGMTGPKVGGAKPSSTQLSQLKKAGVTINESGLPNMQKGGVLHFANGGYLPYGNRLNDSIPALLSGGEYIVNSKAVRKYGVGGLNRINSGVARFQDGGLVGDAAKTNANTESSTSNNVSVNITVNATDGKAQNEQSSADGGDDKNRALGNKIKEVVLQVITNEQRTGGLLDSTKKK